MTATKDHRQAGVLRGVSVVDFGHFTAGPMVGTFLADQGAQVVKVERPGGDPARRSPAFAAWNRGKRSVVLDLKSDAGRLDAERLIAGADVVIENFRPGIADRLGIGYAHAAKLNQRVVYCSIPGFPEGSPQRSSPGWEPIIAAETGTYQRGPQSTAIGVEPTPLYSPLLLPSTFAAFAATGAVAAALIARERYGIGQRVEVPLFSASFAAMGMFLVRIREEDKGWTAWEKLPLPAPYRCKDGRWIQVYGNNRRHLSALFDALGHPEWTEDAVAIVEQAPSNDVVDVWKRRFAEAFAAKNSWDWESSISAAGGVCIVCRTTEEFFALDHAQQAGLFIELDDPTWGIMRQPGIAVNLRSTPGSVVASAPRLGEATVAGLPANGAAARGATEIARTGHSSPGAPLANIRVLDLSILLAGPSCGRTLAEYGADVIKIDDPNRTMRSDSQRTRLMWLDVNRGKRSMLLDLKTDEGLTVFWRLVDTADVIVENFRAGAWSEEEGRSVGPTKLEKLGLGYEDVRKRRPDIVYLSVSAYGRYGEFTNRGGYEQAGQALTGIMVRHGGRGNPPMALAYPYNDYGTGLVAVYGVMLALLERFRTGRGQRLDTSLAVTAAWLQSRYAYDFPGVDRAEREGPELLGLSWNNRLYRAEDHWFILHAVDEAGAWARLTGLPEFADFAARPAFGSAEGRASDQEELARELGDVFATKPRDQWIVELDAAGLQAARHVSTQEVARSATAARSGLITGREHPGFGWVDHAAPVSRLSATPLLLGRPAPADGADTDEILGGLGYSEAEIARFRSARVVG